MAPKTKPKWDIPPRSRACFRGQEVFTSEMVYYALLTTDEVGGYERKDYCASCWQQEIDGGRVPAGSTHWKAMVPARNSKQVDNKARGERAIHLLNEALADHDPAHYPEAFVLALFLQRLRLMAPRQEIVRDGIGYTLYEVLETGEMITVPKVSLSTLEEANVQKSVADKLKTPDEELV